jgi:hypothetical protein
MAYDFAPFLARIDPSQSYSVTQLTGGFVNFTVRACKDGSYNLARGRFPDEESVILKQAPPYMVGVETSAPFSQFRQVGKIVISTQGYSVFLDN